MKTGLKILVFALIISLKLTSQEKIYMPYFEVINMHKDYQISASRLLKTYLEIDNKTELVLPDKDSSYYKETKEQSLLNARNLNINHILIGELNRVGETVVISLSMFNSKGEKEWFTLQKASSPEDLDPVMQKIANSFINRNSSNNKEEDIFNVTEYDSKQLNKKTANSYFGIEIGGGPTSFNIDNSNTAGFGILYSGDIRSIIFDLKGDLFFSEVDLYNINIQVNYPFFKKNSSPYIGGGLGYGGTSVKVKIKNVSPNYDYTETFHGSGLTVYGGAGYIINRASNINLRFNANFFFSAYKVNEDYPYGALLTLMLLF
ncbi:MAG: hypothetical protein KA792_08195 [Bacteroidales bacterium]|nr:hypothetical protein [Bacteroidales bacterium]